MEMTEKGILKPKTCSFEWKVARFFADRKKVGNYHRSPAFPIQYPNKLTKWHLKVYPEGLNENSKDYVSLYLNMESENNIEVTVDFEVSIVNEQLNNLPKYTTTNTFKGRSYDWGWKQFRKQDVIKDTKNGALIDDTLTILCRITFRASDQDDVESFREYNVWIDKIGNGFGDYEQIFENGHFTDVTFNVQEKKINVHKDILSCRSPVFKAMFEHNMKENKQNSVDITDIRYDVMKELFRFLYSGKVKKLDQIASELLIAADKYQMIQLKALCEKSLYESVTVDNAVEYLKLADMCDTIHLKRLIIKFVAVHYKEVAKKPKFADLNSTVMQQIILAIAEMN